MVTLNQILATKPRDVICLSDINNQLASGMISRDYVVTDVATFASEGLFEHRIITAEESGSDESITILCRNFTSAGVFDLLVIDLTTEDSIENLGEFLIDETGENLVPSFEVDLDYDSQSVHVVWSTTSLKTAHGIERSDIDVQSSLGEYVPDLTDMYYNKAYVLWTNEWLQLYYGYGLELTEIEIVNK